MGKARALLIKEMVGRHERKLQEIIESKESLPVKKQQLDEAIKDFSSEASLLGIRVKVDGLRKEYHDRI